MKHKILIYLLLSLCISNAYAMEDENDNNRPSARENSNNNNNAAIAKKAHKQQQARNVPSLQALALIVSLDKSLDEQAIERLPKELITSRKLLKEAVAFPWDDLIGINFANLYIQGQKVERKESIEKMIKNLEVEKRSSGASFDADGFIKKTMSFAKSIIPKMMVGDSGQNYINCIENMILVIAKGTKEEIENLKKGTTTEEILSLYQRLIDNKSAAEALLMVLNNKKHPSIETIESGILYYMVQDADREKCEKFLHCIKYKDCVIGAINIAILWGRKEIVELLLDHTQIESNNFIINVGITAALAKALENDEQGKDIQAILDCCGMVIQKLGIDINKCSCPVNHNIVLTPFDLALHFQNQKVISWLIEHGADVNVANVSPLSFALGGNASGSISLPIVKLLLDNGAICDNAVLELARRNAGPAIVMEIERRIRAQRN